MMHTLCARIEARYGEFSGRAVYRPRYQAAKRSVNRHGMRRVRGFEVMGFIRS